MSRRGFLSLFSVFASLPLVNKVASANPKRVEMFEIKKEAELGVVYHCDFP